MSEIKSESISSLVDDYSPSSDGSVSAHLLDNILKDEELSSTWQNYHLIGDVLRNEVPATLQLDLSQTIADAIALEATILSPKVSPKAFSNVPSQAGSETSSQITAQGKDKATEELVVSKTDTIQDVTQNTIKPTRNIVNATNRFKANIAKNIAKLVKPLGQVAIAASAATLMIVGVQHNVADNSIIPSQVVQTVPLTGYANPVSFSVQAPKFEQSFESKQQAEQERNAKIVAERVAQQRRLQSLLKDHNQQIILSAQ